MRKTYENENNLKYEDVLKYEDNLKYEDDLPKVNRQTYQFKYIQSKRKIKSALSLAQLSPSLYFLCIKFNRTIKEKVH